MHSNEWDRWDEKEGHKFGCHPAEHEYKLTKWWTGWWKKELKGKAEVITKCWCVEWLCCMFDCQSVAELCQLSWREQTAVLRWVLELGWGIIAWGKAFHSSVILSFTAASRARHLLFLGYIFKMTSYFLWFVSSKDKFGANCLKL